MKILLVLTITDKVIKSKIELAQTIWKFEKNQEKNPDRQGRLLIVLPLEIF
jgi:hypothetical protein